MRSNLVSAAIAESNVLQVSLELLQALPSHGAPASLMKPAARCLCSTLLICTQAATQTPSNKQVSTTEDRPCRPLAHRWRLRATSEWPAKWLHEGWCWCRTATPAWRASAQPPGRQLPALPLQQPESRRSRGCGSLLRLLLLQTPAPGAAGAAVGRTAHAWPAGQLGGLQKVTCQPWTALLCRAVLLCVTWLLDFCGKNAEAARRRNPQHMACRAARLRVCSGGYGPPLPLLDGRQGLGLHLAARCLALSHIAHLTHSHIRTGGSGCQRVH